MSSSIVAVSPVSWTGHWNSTASSAPLKNIAAEVNMITSENGGGGKKEKREGTKWRGRVFIVEGDETRGVYRSKSFGNWEGEIVHEK